MVNISADQERVEEEFGLDASRSLLFSIIRSDSSPFVAPLIAETEDGTYLLVRQQEQGNALSAGVPLAKMKFYAPWVTIDDRIIEDTPASPSLESLVGELAGAGAVHLAGDVVFDHYRALSRSLDVTVEKRPEEPVVSYRIDRDEVLRRFRTWRETGRDVARQLIADVEHLDGLDQEIGIESDTRYEQLDEACRASEVDGVVLAAPLNYSEAVGRAPDGSEAALWSSVRGELYVIAPDHVTGVPGVPVERHPSFSAAVLALAGGPRIGIEEHWVETGLAVELESEGAELRPMTSRLGHWRDVRDHEDLGFQVVAARASVFAIEEALGWAAREIDAGREFSELDIYSTYLDRLVEFRVRHRIPFAIEPYFTNLHSSNRMLFPGPPVDYPINGETTCIQLDAGVRISFDGVTVATSDMARSLPRTPAAIEAYELFFKVVREGIIGQLRPGVVCEDVHEGTLEYLAPHLERMIDIGMLGDDVDFNGEYRKRNVGHLMGKQESFANELRPGYKHTLEVGSYGAAEIPWRYHDAAIGTEDLWYIGQEKTYIVSMR